MTPLEELEGAYLKAREDPAFQAELADLLKNFAGRPTPLYFAKRLTEQLGGAKIYIKRRNLRIPARTRSITAWGRRYWRGAWERNGLSPRRARVSMEWPVRRFARYSAWNASSTWGEEDMRRQQLNVFRMRPAGRESGRGDERQPDAEGRR